MEFDGDRISVRSSFRLTVSRSLRQLSGRSGGSSTSGSDDDSYDSPSLELSRSAPSSWSMPSWMSKVGARRRRRSSGSGEFSYDAVSYALNFEDESARLDDSAACRFAARLPPSPEVDGLKRRPLV